jgi:uncharacterized protein (DUF2147 family)
MRLLIMVVGSLLLACASAAAADPKGTWLVEDQSGQIEIENCAGALWGILVWERASGRDTENPDRSLRGRPTLGIPILLGMRPVTEGPQTIWRGQIYNSRNGKTYEASIRQVGPDVLHLEGCVLGGLFCGGQSWTRVKTPARPPSTNAAADFCSRIPDLARGTH